MASSVVVLLASCLCVVFGDVALDFKNEFNFNAPAKPCSFPDQWTGAYGEVIGSSVHKRRGPPREGVSGGMNNITYDYTNKRVALHGIMIHDSRPFTYDMIADFNKKVAYFFHAKMKRCKAIKLKRPMRKMGVPPSAKSAGTFTLGLGSNSLKLNNWAFLFKGKRGHMAVRGTISVTKECVPVGEEVIGHFLNKRFLANIGYFDITAGVRNPKVFNVPSYCKKETEYAEVMDIGEPSPMAYMFYKTMQE